MKNLWQMMLSFFINELFPVAALDAILSAFYWYFNPVLGKSVLVADTVAALSIPVSSIAIGHFLRRQWTEESPYVYKSGFSVLAKRSYFGIEETDHVAFSRLLKAVRRRKVMAPLRPWLLIYDIAWDILIVTFAPIPILMALLVLVMRACSRLIGRMFRAQRAHSR